MGTGKTLVAIEVAKSLGYRPLVVAPKSTHPAWIETLKEQNLDPLDVITIQSLTRSKKQKWYDHDYVKEKLPFPGARYAEKIHKYDHTRWNDEVVSIIWDEVHDTQTPFSGHSRALVDAKGRFNIMASATAAKDPSELWAIGFILGQHSINDFREWACEHGCYRALGKTVKFQNTAFGQVGLQKLHRTLYPEYGTRIDRSEMAEYFPDNQVITDPLDFDDKGGINKLYEEVSDLIDKITDLEGRIDLSDEHAPLVENTRAAQKIEAYKIPVMLDLINEAIRDGFWIVVFTQYRDTQEAISAKLSAIPHSRIVGGQSGKQRANQVALFQDGTHQVALATIDAGGTGLNLHDTHGSRPRMAIISPTWKEKVLHQTLGRTDRAGAQSPVLQRFMFAKGTIEESMAESVRQKLNNLDTLHGSNTSI